MLKLVLKIALALAVVVTVAFGIRSFLAIEGVATIAFAGNEVSMETSRFLLALAFMFGVIWLAIEVLRRGVGSVFAIGGWFRKRRRRRGVDAMSRALIALAEGDGARALRETEKAESLIAEPQITKVLGAQAARMAGDLQRSEQAYEEMADHKETAFLGMMGLLRQALSDQKFERALRLAERAHALRPTKAEVIDILFDLQRRKRDWAGARATMASAVKAGRITRDVSERRRAVLHMAEAMDREAAGEADAALQQSTDALRSAPGLTPAAVMAARLLTAKGELRSARRTLVNAWRIEPHPEVAEAFAALAPTETSEERLKRFEKLFTVRPDSPDTKMLKAELALGADKPEQARDALGDVCQSAPSARAFALMAAIEQAEGADETVVRGLLSRAATAPRSPVWVCASCGTTARHWSHTCPNCDAFDQFAWKRAEGDDTPLDKAITTLLSKAREEPALPEPEKSETSASDRSDAARQAAIAKAASGTALVKAEDPDKPAANGANGAHGSEASEGGSNGSSHGGPRPSAEASARPN